MNDTEQQTIELEEIERLRQVAQTDLEQEEERIRRVVEQLEEEDEWQREQYERAAYQEYGPVSRTPSVQLPPLETLIKKVPGAEKLPSFSSLQEGKKVSQPEAKPASAEDKQKAIDERKKRKKEKLVQKKPKTAMALDNYRILVTGSPAFYRYIRELDPNTRPGKTAYIGPTGGACLLIVLVPGANQIKFSFSLCNEKDRFNKDEARRICQERYRSGIHTLVSDIGPEDSLLNAIERGYENCYFNLNRELNEPKFYAAAAIDQRSLRRLYRMIKDYRKSVNF